MVATPVTRPSASRISRRTVVCRYGSAPARLAASTSSASSQSRRGASRTSTPAVGLTVRVNWPSAVPKVTCRTAGVPVASTSSSSPQRFSWTTPPRDRAWVDKVSLGNCALSTSATSWPIRASSMAVEAPAARAPTTITSWCRSLVVGMAPISRSAERHPWRKCGERGERVWPSAIRPVARVGRTTDTQLRKKEMLTVSSVPDLALNNGQTIPQLGFGVFQIKPEETAEAVQRALEVGYRHIDTAEAYRNEKGVGDGIRAAGLDRERGLRDQQAAQRLPPARRCPGGLRRHTEGARLRLRRPVLDPLAATHAVRRGLRVHLEDDGGVLPGRPGALDRGLQLPGPSSGPAGGRDRGGAGGEPDRGPSVPDQRRGPRLRAGTRHHHRSLVTDRPGRRPRRSRPSPRSPSGWARPPPR